MTNRHSIYSKINRVVSVHSLYQSSLDYIDRYNIWTTCYLQGQIHTTRKWSCRELLNWNEPFCSAAHFLGIDGDGVGVNRYKFRSSCTFHPVFLLCSIKTIRNVNDQMTIDFLDPTQNGFRFWQKKINSYSTKFTNTCFQERNKSDKTPFRIVAV